MYNPRLLKKIESKKEILCFGEGNAAKTTLYQKRICKRIGIFLNVSTYTIDSFDTIQFDDNRPTPTKRPNIEAKTIPIPDTKSVLSNPTINTFP